MAEDIFPAISGNQVNNCNLSVFPGSIVSYLNAGDGFYINSSNVIHTPEITGSAGISGKYIDRFDDPTYYG
jgi:hypothetical protein